MVKARVKCHAKWFELLSYRHWGAIRHLGKDVMSCFTKLIQGAKQKQVCRWERKGSWRQVRRSVQRPSRDNQECSEGSGGGPSISGQIISQTLAYGHLGRFSKRI